ncbi:hypothetical protein Kpol_487p6 [Vanderwaltozyma polyspora DSM 70294]|uniref:RRM domain-containing protein n=1 Tax=Vanderwaltozyma polyspora (strain ATCC 22028 / DSM 70294 / BCRC 21397 / CBS 2163 / NBRC 10782 / NRRL Y-8283 / UCD 57-17) TaxID=436907 RepID=A7TQ81_VANPO|nr:uncharacterized protein Kpol_487p6 [Vanderwaltozyma polyspora DSM 70294]EDO15573.1 hypothetical protein Kpol_487p6 [Vanderwaltozyma polyspora DSM 70294]
MRRGGGYGGSYPNRYNDGRRRGPGPRDMGRGRGGGGRGFGRSRGDYGPILDRDLDSTYEEKVNRNYANSVFVGNLTYDCTPEDLRDHFSTIGEVVRADIITSRGHHRGMGTVEFTNADDVNEAISQYDGSYLLDRQIFVRQDNPPPEASHESEPPRERRERRTLGNDGSLHSHIGYEVFIANLPYSINWQALKDMFKECGSVIRADVELDRNGYSRGFGTVILGSQEDMERAISMYNGYELEGRVLEVREGRSNNQDEEMPISEDIEINDNGNDINDENAGTSDQFTDGVVGGGEKNELIYCSNLPFSTAKSDLFDLFETIGKLKNAELKFDQKGNPTGVAIVEYENVDDAQVCVDRLNNYNYGGCDLDISYGKRE